MAKTIQVCKDEKMPPGVLRAYHYYLKGLTAKETGKLINVSPRTVQRWASEYEFKEKASPDTLQQKTARLFEQGFSYREIAETIKKSKTTVYYYLREGRKGSQGKRG
ncbi:terminase gpP N-terminus-related DNA-binding protein [Flavitalea flava]